MHQSARHDDVTTAPDRSGLLAPDTMGMNFYRADHGMAEVGELLAAA
jgi:hypothetical protein